MPLLHGFGEVGITVGEEGHIPPRHGLTAEWILAAADFECAGGGRRRSSRATTPRRRCRERSVVRCDAVWQSTHDGPGGGIMDAATTTCPHIATYSPRPADNPTSMAWSLTRWSRPLTAQVIVAVREVVPRRVWSTVGMASPS